jgi:hypothetical protein
MIYETNRYGFRWGEVLVERTCSQEKKPFFQVLRIYAPNGQVVELTMTKRKTRVDIAEALKHIKPAETPTPSRTNTIEF